MKDEVKDSNVKDIMAEEDEKETTRENNIYHNNTRNRNLNVMIAVILFFIVLFGGLFYLFEESSIFGNKYTYTNKETGSKYSFVREKINNDLTMNILTTYSIYKGAGHKYDIPFRNSPKDLENIPVDADIKKKIIAKQRLYITLDPELEGKATIASVEIGRILGTAEWGVFQIPTGVGTTRKTNTTYPVITCMNSSPRTGVLWLRLGNTTHVISDKDCIIIEGKNYNDLIKAADKLAYNLLGVLP